LTTIAIIGAGPLGRWLALAAARAGFRVFLEDVMPSNLHHAQEYLRRELSSASPVDEGQGFSPDNQGEGPPGASAPAHVHFVSTVEDAVRGADLAIDCVPDELESKLEILWLLDRMAPPRTVIATPTTNLSIVDLAGCTYRPEKCVAIAASPQNLSNERPGSPIRLISTPCTAPETIELVLSFWERLGFFPAFESAST
jgi:3-hydroxybutyryl-CoA dehydrogenase